MHRGCRYVSIKVCCSVSPVQRTGWGDRFLFFPICNTTSVPVLLFPGVFILGARQRCSGPFVPFQFVFHGPSGVQPRFLLYYIDATYLFGHVDVAADVVAVGRCMKRITELGNNCISVLGC